MIITKLSGGLGNQMFQYSLAWHLAIRNNDDKLRFDLSEFKNDINNRQYGLNDFNIIGRPLLITDIKESLLSIKQKNHYFDKSVLDKKGNLYITGTWICEDYFKDIREVLIKDFTLKKGLDERNKKMLKLIKDTNSVAIHARRTDYVNNPSTKNFHGNCSLDYYYDAIFKMEELVEDPTFFIFSDDIEWCKKKLRSSYSIFIEGNPPHIDLELMKNCKNFIIANSSFSWWGAWLSENPDKIIIAPDKWVIGVDEGDIVPKDWMRINGSTRKI